MKTMTLTAEAREVLGKKVDHLRKEGKIPAVLYGHGSKNINLTLDLKSFITIFKVAGSSSLIDLQVGDQKPTKVLIHDFQKNVVTDEYIHVDFQQVDMKKKLTAEVILEFVGESKAVKENGGVLYKSLDKVKIECLPENLVHEIKVDISALETFENRITVKDLKLPEGVEVIEKGQIMVANVQTPRTEEELKSLEDDITDKVDDVEKVDGKEGEEEVADGDDDKKEGDKKTEDAEEKPAAGGKDK
ncbi:MAG: 50S ribosomal protein L25 [Candidatus Kerfeldbacteria bacterium]